MANSRLTNLTKEKLKLVKKECLRISPDLEQMTMSENYLINRMANHFLKGSPYQRELSELEK